MTARDTSLQIKKFQWVSVSQTFYTVYTAENIRLSKYD